MHSEGGLGKTIRDSLLILFFETLGTAILCCLYNTSLRYGDLCGFLMGTFVTLVLSVRISGSHYNPAVTFAYIFRRDVGKFSRVLGIAYWVAQFVGAFGGAMLSWWFCGTVGFIGIAFDESKYIPAAIVAESVGTMLLVFLYLT
jgi:glycerol uptake facilitator-like aquaporin